MIDKNKLLAAAAGAIALVAAGLAAPSTAEAQWRGGWHRGHGWHHAGWGWRHGWGWRGGPRWWARPGFVYPAVFAGAALYPRPYFLPPPPPPPVFVPRPVAYVPPPPAYGYGYGSSYGSEYGYRSGYSYAPRYSHRAPAKKRYVKKVRCKCPDRKSVV